MAEFETDGSSALAPKDPYRDMDRSDIRPNLKVIEGGKSKSEGAKEGLASAEKSAVANPLSVVKGGADDAKSAEQNQAFSPRFTGKGLPNGGKDGKGKKKGVLSGKGPLIGIVMLLAGGGGLMAGSQMMMPFATANRVIQEFNSMKTIMSRRSDRILRFQLDTDRYKSPTRTTIFGNDKFKISGKQATKLKTEGIEYMQLDSGRRVLVFDDGSGKKQPILSNSDTGKLPNGDLSATDIADIRAKGGFADGVEINTKAMNIDSAFELDGFKYGYMKTSKTWKGNIAGWFDSLVLKIFDRLGISRSRFKKWDTANNVEAGNAEFKKLASADVDPDSGTEVRKLEDVDSDDPDDPDVREVVESDSDQDRVRPGDSEETVKTKLGNKAMAVAKAASAASSAICAVMAAAGAINALVVATEVAQIINFVTGYLESVQKVQAGDGDGSPMSNYTNMLTTADASGKTGMSSQGIGALFGSGRVDPSDESAKMYNLEEGIKLIGLHAKYTIQDMMLCSYARMAAGAVDAIVDAILLIGSFGIGNLLKGLFKEIALSAAISAGIGILVSAVIPGLAKLMTRDLINGALGEDLGNAIASGGNMYLGRNHQGGGGSPGDSETVLAYKRETQAILAEEAEYDRATKSPFDTSSQNTFLGSLLYSLIPMANSTSGIGLLSNLGTLTANSLTSLMPSASAVADTKLMVEAGDCPTLAEVGIMGDAFCNPYYTSDLTTAGMDPGEDIFETVARFRMGLVTSSSPLNSEEGGKCYNSTLMRYEYDAPSNFKYLKNTNDDNPTGCMMDVELDAHDNPVINLDSELGHYIVFCGQRDSQYGVADAAITAAFKLSTGDGTVDSVLSGGLGAIPIIGGLADIADAAQDRLNAPWIGGNACVATDQNDLWSENKYYQRYAEDQRLFEESGIIDKSSVTIALDEYYEENPLDKSYEGILARYSGMSKDDVIATLEIVDYASFIAEYDPSGLAPTVVENAELSLADQAPDVTVAYHSDAPVVQYIMYADTRSRYYTV